MIVGIGTDIIEIDRVKDAMKRNSRFIEKLFNEEEIEYLKSKNLNAESVAGRFAAKEAVSKCLGTGFRGFGFKDIIIKRDSIGKPYVELKEKAENIVKHYKTYNISLSISHSRENAIAYAVLEADK